MLLNVCVYVFVQQVRSLAARLCTHFIAGAGNKVLFISKQDSKVYEHSHGSLLFTEHCKTKRECYRQNKTHAL
jgi:hypothetical protein